MSNTTQTMTSPYYLPAGQRVAVRDSRGTLIWYTTKKDVPLTGAEMTVRCPMRSDRDVLTTSFGGCDVFFLLAQRRVRLQEQEAASSRKLDLYQLVYDVPSGQGIPSPCPWLYPIAIRINLSCWIVPKDRIPYTRLNELTEAGANWHLTKFDSSEAQNLIERAIDSLTAEMRESVERATQAQLDAETILTGERATNRDPNENRKKYLARMEQIKKRFEELSASLNSATNVFGIDPSRLGREAATRSIQAIAAGMHQRAASYTAAANAARAVGTTDGAAIANVADRNEMPAGVLADFLRDNGREDEADAVQSAFSESDETFSLVGADEDSAE